MLTPDDSPPAGPTARLASGLVLAGPVLVLTAAAALYGPVLLAAACVMAAAGAVLFVRYPRSWRPPASGLAVLVYLAAFTAVSLAAPNPPDAFARVARAGLLLAAVALFAGHDLMRSGLSPRREAQRLCRRLANRGQWPATLDGYADLPEVRGLADALRTDPTPALGLLTSLRPEVQAAAVVALRGRPHWRAVEAIVVLDAARRAADPAVRAAAVGVLATADDPEAVAGVAEFLRDPDPGVRGAAAVSVLAGGARRWPLVRDGVRDALADPQLAADGPLPGGGGRLPAMAVCDLFTWAAEMEPLAGRAARTLVEHYAVWLRSGEHPELPAQLGDLATDPATPAGLRVEVTVLLRAFGLITPQQLDRMTDPDQPGPVRLLAAEALLAANPDHADAVGVLRGLGRQQNRETALTIARILQTYLGMDMGLPADGEVPPTGKAATEAAKRVLAWATGGRVPADAGLNLTGPLSAPTFSGIQGQPGDRDGGGIW
jgi:hypothetical protein